MQSSTLKERVVFRFIRKENLVNKSSDQHIIIKIYTHGHTFRFVLQTDAEIIYHFHQVPFYLLVFQQQPVFHFVSLYEEA